VNQSESADNFRGVARPKVQHGDSELPHRNGGEGSRQAGGYSVTPEMPGCVLGVETPAGVI
jgi:hypothetical protein